jgi:hypothetical protein
LGAKSAVASGFERIGVATAALWTGLFLGPALVAAAEFMDYAFDKWTCTHESRLVQGGITAVALLGALAAMAIAWRELRRVPDQAASDGARPIDVARFMAALGLAMSVFTALTIVAFSVPQWVLDACQ